MDYVFGKDIVRSFYPLENDLAFAIPTQNPRIYLFTSNPSLTVASSGSGAAQSITSWNQQESEPYGCTYTFTAVNDPSPTGTTDYQQYWEAINYVPKVGVTIAPLIRTFYVRRLLALESVPSTSTQDLKDIYPAITSYLTESQLVKMLAAAQEDMKLDLEVSGLKWSKIYDLYKTKLGLAFKTISLAALSQIVEANDRHAIRYDEFEKKYQKVITSIKLPYDTNGTGAPGEPRELKRAYYIASR